jgi:hypothetical protein
MLKNSYIFPRGRALITMKLDHFNSIRKGGRSIDTSNVTKSLTVHTVAKLKLLFKKSPRLRKHTAYRRVLPIRPMPTETMYSLQ